MQTMTTPSACAGCGAALATDQRYCLHCGAAQGDPRVAYRELIAPARAAAAAPPPGQPGGPGGPGPHQPTAATPLAPPRDWTPVIALGGLGTLALVLVVGVLIGKSGSSSQPAAAAPQVITVSAGTAPPATAATATADTTVSEDWPSGKTGFTVELGTLAKDGTTAGQVSAAKTAAAAKGAPKVGALDSDEHSSLTSGNYVIYSGVFAKRAAAKKALGKLKAGGFPDAKLIAVNDGSSGGSGASSADKKAGGKAVQDLNNSTGQDYQKKSSKLPDTVALPGKPPPKDDKAPGGGSGGETIG